ncbi:MAG TPA: hypothetical protein VJS64_09445 [Pyrinomonadaceae bacterium]|nr:hypothetical protein [Pyrinomonadaceae bacterium]
MKDDLAIRMNSTAAAMALNELAKYDRRAVDVILEVVNGKGDPMAKQSGTRPMFKIRWIVRWYARDGTIREVYFDRYRDAREESTRHKDAEVFRQERMN